MNELVIANPAKNIEKIREGLLSQDDGPVTKHIVIFRALRLAFQRKEIPMELSEATDQALEILVENGGSLPSNEFAGAYAL